MQKSVYLVHHVHEEKGRDEDVKLIGVYSSKDAARNAVLRLRVQPGFRHFLKGFKITKYELDKDHWTEGFITVVNQPDGTIRYENE